MLLPQCRPERVQVYTVARAVGKNGEYRYSFKDGKWTFIHFLIDNNIHKSSINID